MKAVVFATAGAALIFRNAIDNALNYPRQNVDLQGNPVPGSTTDHYATVRPHPSLALFAVKIHLLEANHPALVAYLQAHGLVIVDLDPTWEPTPPGAGT